MNFLIRVNATKLSLAELPPLMNLVHDHQEAPDLLSEWIHEDLGQENFSKLNKSNLFNFSILHETFKDYTSAIWFAYSCANYNKVSIN